MWIGSGTNMTSSIPSDINTLQVRKYISCVTKLDVDIARLEGQLQSQLGSGDLEVRHNLEMRNDEKVHIRAVLRDKRDKLGKKEEKGEELSQKVESAGLQLDESFRHNAPIKSKYLEASAEYIHILNEIQKLEEEESQLRAKLERITPVLRYLESTKVLNRKYRDIATQCYGNEFSYALSI